MAHELQQATANQSLLKCHPTLAVDSVQTEDVFCQVDSDCCNLHHWTLLPTSVRMVEFTILALKRPFQVVGLGPSHQYRSLNSRTTPFRRRFETQPTKKDQARSHSNGRPASLGHMRI